MPPVETILKPRIERLSDDSARQQLLGKLLVAPEEGQIGLLEQAWIQVGVAQMKVTGAEGSQSDGLVAQV